MIDLALIRQFAPTAKPALAQGLVDGWPRMQAVAISTPLRVAHFMTQLATETGGFTITEENMNYSAERMTQVWPSRFHTVADAQPYAHNPEKLANNVYGGRMGNVDPGDGWKYHGRGYMQTTGRENYKRIGHEKDPEALLQPAVALDAAIEEWTRGRLNAVADADDLRTIRKVINGGLIGLETAAEYLARAKRTFTAAALGDPPVMLEPWDQIDWPISPIGTYRMAWIQDALNRLSPPALAIRVDGITGVETTYAIRRFQHEQNLHIDGVAGPITVSVIKDMLNLKGLTP